MTVDRLFRDPLSVPTPIAIALADFCRRADRGATSEEVRLALACVPAAEDAKIAAFCAGDPPAVPLSPLAAIDVYLGRPAGEAARLELDGHYREALAALTSLPIPSAAQAEETFESRALAGTDGGKDAGAPKERKPTKGRKGTKGAPEPVRRSREEVESRRLEAEQRRAAPVSEEEAPSPPRPGRSPAAPQFGRFVGGPAARRPLRDLGADELADIVSEMRANRRAILERIDALYSRDDRSSLGPADLSRLLRKHALEAHFVRAERENLKGLLRQNRGFLPPIRRALGMTAAELRRAIGAHGLETELRMWQERLREEARAEAPLAERLALALARTEALRAAGALDDLEAFNRARLREALDLAAATTASKDPVVL
ncbi:MAG TPA: hypothetical protein VGD74_06330, partial [Vulgatibacter sp.]